MKPEEYVVTPEKQKLFDKLLELLEVFDKVCRENDIKYFAYAGTLIGAIRHNGFIPWDDDVDVILLREDYNKFKQIMKDKPLPAPFFFQSPETDPGYPKGFCKLRNSDTTLIAINDSHLNCNHGVFIDLLPVDAVPDGRIRRKIQSKALKIIRKLMGSYARYYSGYGAKCLSQPKKIFYYISLPFFKLNILNNKKLYAMFEREMQRYENVKTREKGSLSVTLGEKSGAIWERDSYSVAIDHVFENLNIMIPRNYDENLRYQFGDYMVPVMMPTDHGAVLFDADVPYNEFIEKNKALLRTKWVENAACANE